METIHQIIKESVSEGFLTFLGYYFIIACILLVPAKFAIYTVGSLFRHLRSK